MVLLRTDDLFCLVAIPDIICPVFFLNLPTKKFLSGVTWGGLPPPSDATVLSGQSTKTNKAASDATIEARVVMFFGCAEWCGAALSPTGR